MAPLSVWAKHLSLHVDDGSFALLRFLKPISMDASEEADAPSTAEEAAEPAPAPAPAPASASPSFKQPAPALEFENATRMGELRVVVLRARGLPAADKGGISDPYAMVKVFTGRTLRRQHKHRTAVAKKTLNPAWNTAFQFRDISVFDTKIEITVFDEDATSKFDADDPLGQIEFTLRELVLKGLPRDGTLLTLPPLPLRAAKKQNIIKAQGTLEVMVGWVFEMPVRFHANDKGTDAVLEGGGVFCKGKNSGFAWTTTCGEPIGRGNGKQRVEVLVGDCDEHSASFGIVAPTADRNELLGFLQPGSIALFANGSLFIDGKRDSRTRGFGEGDSLTLSVSPSIVEPSSFQVIYGINGEEVYRREDVSAGWNFAFGGYGNFTNYKIIDPTPEPPPPPPPVRRRAEREQASAQQ